MSIQSPRALLAYEMQSILDAENQASQAMQRLVKSAENPRLRKMVEMRLKQGERVVRETELRLEKLDGGVGSVKNAAARGLIKESETLMKEVATPEMQQAVMIAGLQKLEHYCIATWGTVRAMAGELGETQIARSMERAIQEGYKWDGHMTELAEKRINPEALQNEDER